MADSATHTFQRVPDLKAIVATTGVDLVVAGFGYESWEDAIRKRQRFTACVRRGPVHDGTPIPEGSMRFVLLLQGGWSRNITAARTCGTAIVTGEVENVVATYLSAAATDPRKLIARHYSQGIVAVPTRMPLVPVHLIFGLEADGRVLLPFMRGPYLVSA